MKQKEHIIAQTLSSLHLFELGSECASSLAYKEAIARSEIDLLIQIQFIPF
jgi:hypothetical protein